MIKDKGGQDGEGVRMGVFFFGCRMQDARGKLKVTSHKLQVSGKRKKDKG